MLSSLILALPVLATASLIVNTKRAPLEVRASCPPVHVFGARETTASPGYGSSSTVVNLVTSAYSGATSEAIDYPACGGQSTCGGVSYANSAAQGAAKVVSVVNAYVAQCPSTQIVLVGYSQGGQIIDTAFCGGGDSTEGVSSGTQLNSAALAAVKAVIMMGNPRYEYGFSYEVGTCKAGGFDARPASFQCPGGHKVQSYCDAADPYCCNGNDANTHNGYGAEYGSAALTFIKGKLSSGNSASSVGTTVAVATTAAASTASEDCTLTITVSAAATTTMAVPTKVATSTTEEDTSACDAPTSTAASSVAFTTAAATTTSSIEIDPVSTSVAGESEPCTITMTVSATGVSTAAAPTATGTTVGSVAKWGQCAGQGTPTLGCASGLTCKFINAYYSQCQ
ncbi:hypothetical protein LTR62_008875 [Meristemomyces frigidus]|uniref:CBM1 domain-containing protein n=1 Tax=Meristemomyces frigidus TaxID=1508187 RepID=A0AAN7YGV6_9PEZI|nr:hypothetical protein LTR62_008875 [Meristemomyces frigidus]